MGVASYEGEDLEGEFEGGVEEDVFEEGSASVPSLMIGVWTMSDVMWYHKEM